MERKRRFIINSLYYGIIIFLVLLCFLFLYRYCILIILSYLTALIIQPLIDHTIKFFNIHHKMTKTIISIFLTLIIYLFIIIFFVISLYIILHVFHFLPDYLQDIYEQFIHNHYVITLSQTLYENIKTLLDTIFSKILHLFFSIIINITTIIGYIFFHLMLTILFILDHTIKDFFFLHHNDHFNTIIDSIKKTCNIIIKTYMIIFIVTLICLYGGFFIIKLDNSFMIAFLIALFDFFPVLGIDMIMIPWIILCMILNEIQLAIALLVIYLITTIIRNILEPHLMSKQAKIPALYMFIAMFVMMKMMGIIGMIITPFLLTIIKNIIESEKLKNKMKKVDFLS